MNHSNVFYASFYGRVIEKFQKYFLFLGRTQTNGIGLKLNDLVAEAISAVCDTHYTCKNVETPSNYVPRFYNVLHNIIKTERGYPNGWKRLEFMIYIRPLPRKDTRARAHANVELVKRVAATTVFSESQKKTNRTHAPVIRTINNAPIENRN